MSSTPSWSLKAAVISLLLLPTSSSSLLRRQRSLRAAQHTTLDTHVAVSSDPGAVIAATIEKLKKTEGLLRETQGNMQSAVDKMVAERAVTLDKHIDHITSKVMTAFHEQEVENLQKATEARMNDWGVGENATAIKAEVPEKVATIKEEIKKEIKVKVVEIDNNITMTLPEKEEAKEEIKEEEETKEAEEVQEVEEKADDVEKQEEVAPVNAGDIMTKIKEEEPAEEKEEEEEKVDNCNTESLSKQIRTLRNTNKIRDESYHTSVDDLRVMMLQKVEQDYACKKEKMEESKSQRDAAKWKLAGDSNNIEMKSIYDEWKSTVEYNTQLLNLKENERDSAQMAEESIKSGANPVSAAVEKMDEDTDMAANLFSEQVMKGNDGPTAGEMADAAAAAKREAEEANKKMAELEQKMKDADAEEGIKKEKAEQAERDAQLKRDEDLRLAEAEMLRKTNEENDKMEEKARLQAEAEERRRTAEMNKAQEEKAKAKGKSDLMYQLAEKKIAESEKQQKLNQELLQKQLLDRQAKAEAKKEEDSKQLEAKMAAQFEEQSSKRAAENEVKSEEAKKVKDQQKEMLQKAMNDAEANKKVQEENMKASEKASEEKEKALDAKHEAEKALAEHMSKSEIDRLKQVQANMEEESLKTSERAKISEQNAKDQATKDDAQRKKEAEQQEAAAEKAADEAAAKNEMQMKHSEEMMKAEQLKNQQKDEANTKLMESMKSGNKAAQKAAMEKLALAAKGTVQVVEVVEVVKVVKVVFSNFQCFRCLTSCCGFCKLTRCYFSFSFQAKKTPKKRPNNK